MIGPQWQQYIGRARAWRKFVVVLLTALLVMPVSSAQPPTKKPPGTKGLPDRDLLGGNKDAASESGSVSGKPSAAPKREGDGDTAAGEPHRADWGRVAELMRRAAVELAGGRTEASTQQIQAEALTVLTALAEADRQASGRQKSPSQQTQPKKGQQPSQSPPRQAAKGAPSADDRPIRSTLDPEDAAAVAARVWGQLRADLQSRLRAAGRVEFLPGFEKQIERYYQDLGQPARR